MSANKELGSKLQTFSKRNRKPRGKPHGKIRKKISASVRASSTAKAVSRADAVVKRSGRSLSRESKPPVPASTIAKEIRATDWPEAPQELRRLIPEPVHPAADRLPLWPREKLVAAAQAVQATGKQIDPVQRLRSTGEIVDGRNTRLIALMAGLKPHFVNIDLPPNMTAEEYVEYRNVVRRQLPLEQLALFAAKRYIGLREEGKRRRSRNLCKGTQSPEMEKIPNRQQVSSLEFLANLFSVNAKYIQDAAVILEEEPELSEKVAAGEVKFSDARAQMGLVQHRSRRRDTDHSAPIASANGYHAQEMDGPVTPQGIDYAATLTKLLKDILHLRSTPQAKRELAVKRLIQEALEIQTQQLEADNRGSAASAQ